LRGLQQHEERQHRDRQHGDDARDDRPSRVEQRATTAERFANLRQVLVGPVLRADVPQPAADIAAPLFGIADRVGQFVGERRRRVVDRPGECVTDRAEHTCA
jgi:hypothetical protein